MSRLGRTFVFLVILMGFLAIGESLVHLYRVPIGAQWLLLGLLTLISGSAGVELPRTNVTISISEAFVFAAVLLYGPSAGTLTVALDGLVISFWLAKRRPEVERVLFNIAAPALSAWCSAQLFFKASGIAPLSEQPASLNQILPSLVLFAVTYFGLNSGLIAVRIAIHRRANVLDVWRDGFVWLSLNYFCGASVAVLLVGYNRTIDLRFVGIVVPLLLVLYFTFKTSMERVEDAYRHVGQLNTLYLSTIETLAMAIDAKDQITHGHIRRVQAYAVGLAKELGVSDEKLIKAIEAAALLHDMGKLAVPEYILNKPGKLTPVEFEKMKLHVTIGADILGAIDFPYPVVPIVRCHHESWNGTGYPEGLCGTNIPIGARILSVVDCFDALTSDRPYRPRLSDEAALAILQERRGSMYDPLVVDTFARVYRDIAPKETSLGPPRHALREIVAATQASFQAPHRLPEESKRSDGTMPDSLALQSHFDATERLRALTSASIDFSLGVLFINNRAIDELEVAAAFGAGAADLDTLRIPLGQRLSGWVAVNNQTILNSAAALDLGDIALDRGLQACLSTPLTSSKRFLGVITLYTASENGFSDGDRRALEAIARGHDSLWDSFGDICQTQIVAGALDTVPFAARSVVVRRQEG
ncbi:MAG: HD domain-containing phosphohydrolase [Acidobacteriota bacterium]